MWKRQHYGAESKLCFEVIASVDLDLQRKGLHSRNVEIMRRERATGDSVHLTAELNALPKLL